MERMENPVTSKSSKKMYVIVFTLPSGSKWAAGAHEGNLALVPVPKEAGFQKMSKVISFDTQKEAELWLVSLKKQTGSKWKAWLNLKPRIVQVLVESIQVLVESIQ